LARLAVELGATRTLLFVAIEAETFFLELVSAESPALIAGTFIAKLDCCIHSSILPLFRVAANTFPRAA
jgi:hypothetical protein